MAVESTSSDTIRLEARLTLMAEMLQRAAEEARLLVDAYTAEMRHRDVVREEGNSDKDTNRGDTR